MKKLLILFFILCATVEAQTTAYNVDTKSTTLPATCRATNPASIVILRVGTVNEMYIGTGSPCTWKGPFTVGLTDVTITSPLTGHYLRYNGTNWVNAALLPADIPAAVDAAKIADGSVSNAEYQALDGGISKSEVGLGNVDNTADASKAFAASQVTSGTMATARLGSGTANSTTFLRGDQTWAAPAGSGDVTLAGTQTFTGAKTFNDGTLKVGGADYGASDGSLPAVVAGAIIRNTNASSKRWFLGRSDGAAWDEIMLPVISGPMSVANGGTGVATLIGIPKGNGTSAFTPAKADELEAPVFAADAGSNDTYVATLAPAITAYVTGAHYRFKANTLNTGAATINLNALGAKTIKKAAGGITTDLATNDILAGQWVDLVYDGTNMQMQSTLGNAAGGGGTPGGSDTQIQYNNAAAFGGVNLYRVDANTLRQRNGATAQIFQVAAEDDNAGNFNRIQLGIDGGTGVASILTTRGGTGGSGNFRIGPNYPAELQFAINGAIAAKFDSIGHFSIVAGQHLIQTNATNDITGSVATSASTSATYTFVNNYTAAPACVLTPKADPGAGVRWWVTTTTSTVVAHTDVSTTLDFFFHCFGAPN